MQIEEKNSIVGFEMFNFFMRKFHEKCNTLQSSWYQ